MSASASFDPPGVPVDGAGVTVAVALYDRSAGDGERYTFLPNVRCERVRYEAGPVPPSAQFSYVLDTSDPDNPYPAYAEDLWPLAAEGPGVVALGAELVVFVADESGAIKIVFDGFADAPQIDLTPNGQAVTFTATGVAVRCWDRKVGGAVYRSGYDPEFGDDVATDLLARFNPDGEPNKTPNGFDTHEGEDDAYPVFLDHRIRRKPDPREFWSLGPFARYLFADRPAPSGGGALSEADYVPNPPGSFLANLDVNLQALKPTADAAGTIDVSDPSSYQAEDIILDDVDATDRPWPEVLGETLNRHGFGLLFTLGQQGGSGPLPEPKNGITFYRMDGLFSAPPKDLYLQPAGAALDPGRTNLGALRVVRDGRDGANLVRVATRPKRFEVSIVLAPGFHVAASDATNPDQFKTSQLATATGELRAKYRVYVADEGGDGHWTKAGVWVDDSPLDLSKVFGKPADPEDPPYYVGRNRPGFDTLLSKDDAGRFYRAELAISTDYAGPAPGVFDPTASPGVKGTWQSLGSYGWRLLKDRLGVELTTDNPNGWKIPDVPTGTTPVIPGGVVRGVEAQAAPSGALKKFYLRLTCVIEADQVADAVAPRRDASPSPFTVEKVINGRDVYRADKVDPSSIHYAAGPGSKQYDRDDADKAKARAIAYRSLSEFPPVAGRATVPAFTAAYRVGDRVRRVSGRGVDLRTNAGAGVGESPYYPTVVALSWEFSGESQSTSLELADHRAEPGAGPPATAAASAAEGGE